MIRDLNIDAGVTRTVAGTVVTLHDPPVKFKCALDIPSVAPSMFDGSPRSNPNYTIRWPRHTLSLDAEFLGPGARVLLNRPIGSGVIRAYENVEYEITAKPRELRSCSYTFGLEATVFPVSELYPVDGTLVEQDGTVIGPIQVAIWQITEEHNDRGSYDNFEGETSVAYLADFGQNKAILIDGVKYRIVTTVLDKTGLVIKFTARVANVA